MGKKYQVDEKFFSSWSHEMSYLLGNIYADGSLEDASYLRGKYLRVTSIDEEMIINLKKYLKSKHKILKLPPRTLKSHIRYFIRIGSHKLYNSLVRLGLYPNKSLTINFPKVPKKYLSDFIRGYFDGDGCVSIQKNKKGVLPRGYKGLSVIFTSGSADFLKNLDKNLRGQINIWPRRIILSHRSFQLRYTTEDGLKIFKYMYRQKPELFLMRKMRVFKEYLSKRPKRVDKTIQNILLYYRSGHVVK